MDTNEAIRRAESLSARGAHGEARDALRAAAQASPHVAGLWWRLAIAESAVGDEGAVIESLARALQAGPADAQDWHRIGWVYLSLWRADDARTALERAAALDPGRPDIERHLAAARHQCGDTGGAAEALARAARRAPGDLQVEVAQALLLPQVYDDAADVRAWRERYDEGLGRLERSLPRWLPHATQVLELGQENFLLAYQGEDDRDLQRRYSRFIATLAAAARPQWRAPLAASFDGRRKLRIGFVGAIFRDCTAGRYFEHWIAGLDPGRFERHVFHTAPVADDFTRRIQASCERFTVLRTTQEGMAERLREAGLDAIVHPEVGMTPSSYLLAALRLAPLQAAGWGHPVTTGSDAIDAYFSCGEMEPADAAGHYVERLRLLPGLGVRYAMPEVGPSFSRADMGMPEGSSLYACPQSLFKIHPDMDAVFAEILAADPAAVLLFFQASTRALTERFARRVQEACAARGLPPRGQFKFLPRMAQPVFRRVLASVDVVVDTLRWSGGNTSLDAFAAGTPVVSCPGRFMRARQTAAMLRAMGLDELVVRSPGELAAVSVAVATDRARNAALRAAIRERRGAIFDRPEPVEAFADAIWSMALANR